MSNYTASETAKFKAERRERTKQFKKALNGRGKLIELKYPSSLPAYKRGMTAPGSPTKLFPSALIKRSNGTEKEIPYQVGSNKVKSSRIVSESELKAVQAAKRDVGHRTRKQYSKIAQRRVPKALHNLYGLPIRDSNRTKQEMELFKAN